ncbi:MAG TPA: hypothetical protein VJQ55_05560 [Candidatus Binatia bacterium]|nr:hypothetical protein [Candidatus Binatia bacterium]
MPHSKSLRAIGQSLESLGVVAFVMERDGRNYVVRSDSLPEVAELDAKKDLTEKVWDIGGGGRRATLIRENGSLRYEPPYVSWLDAQGRKRRRRRFSAQATGTMKVSQLLRAVGRHLDRVEPHAFSIQWTEDSVIVDYQTADGQNLREVFPVEKLRELTVRSRFRRARRK